MYTLGILNINVEIRIKICQFRWPIVCAVCLCECNILEQDINKRVRHWSSYLSSSPAMNYRLNHRFEVENKDFIQRMLLDNDEEDI
jgi:hypothetical protein